MGQNEPNELTEFDEFTESTELTPNQERAIDALLTTRTMSQAAARADVGRRSISRWLREDENFQRELKAARRDALAQTTARLQQLSAGAVDVLHDILQDKKASSASRVSGVRAALDFAYRALELEDIEERLSAVERRLEEEPPAKPPVSVKWIEMHDEDEQEQQSEG